MKIRSRICTFLTLRNLLFLNDDVCKFFSKTLILMNGHFSQALILKTETLKIWVNFMWQNFLWNYTHLERHGLFWHAGIIRHYQEFENERSLSLSGGVIVNSLSTADISTSQKLIPQTFAGALEYFMMSRIHFLCRLSPLAPT